MMEVQKEAQRIMTMSVWKMYHSRMQRGGLRLHRSLQLSLVMRSARDLYLSAKLEDEDEEETMAMAAAAEEEEEDEGLGHGAPTPAPEAPAQGEAPPPDPEPMDTQPPEAEAPATQPQPQPEGGAAPWRSCGRGSGAKPSRKRRSSSLGRMGAAEAGLAPSKKARLAREEEEAAAEEAVAGRPGGEAPRQEEEEEEEGPFPSLARVLQGRFSAPPPAKAAPGEEPPANCCRQGEGGVLSILVRAVVAF